MPRTLNPLGIRKLDVQAERRAALRDAWIQVRYKMLNPYDTERMLHTAYMQGWEQGVKVGAQATRDRVAEALDKGTLIKP